MTDKELPNHRNALSPKAKEIIEGFKRLRIISSEDKKALLNDFDLLEETLPSFAEYSALDIRPSNRISNCIAVLDAVFKQKDTEKEARARRVLLEFLEKTSPDSLLISGVIGSTWVPARIRDEYSLYFTPLIEQWAKNSQNASIFTEAVKHEVHELLGICCRNEHRSWDLFSTITRNTTPNEMVRIDTYGVESTWVMAWANNCFDVNENVCSGELILQWLIDWGVDVNQLDPHSTPIINSVLKNSRMGANHKAFVLENLTAVGAKWEKDWRDGSPDERRKLAATSTVKREKLWELARKNGFDPDSQGNATLSRRPGNRM